MAQIVYYFYAAIALGAPHRKVSFSVPTGNFGDVFAGYLARQMGLPIEKLIIATNRNDVLHRVLQQGVYQRTELHHTLSPSMDISISSNFERLMFDLYDRDGQLIKSLMEQFESQAISLTDHAIAQARGLFSSATVDDQLTCATIADIYARTGYLLDPHSATAVAASKLCRDYPDQVLVNLATAHPAKFSAAIEQAIPGMKPPMPAHMADIYDRPEQYTVLDDDAAAVQTFILNELSQ